MPPQDNAESTVDCLQTLTLIEDEISAPRAPLPLSLNLSLFILSLSFFLLLCVWKFVSG